VKKERVRLDVKVGTKSVHICSHKHFGDDESVQVIRSQFPASLPTGYETENVELSLCSSGTDCVGSDNNNKRPRLCDDTISITFVPGPKAKKHKERVSLYKFCTFDCMKRTMRAVQVGSKLVKDRDNAFKKKGKNESTYVIRNWRNTGQRMTEAAETQDSTA